MWPGLASRAPRPDGSSRVVIFVYFEDVDKTVERAVAGGAKQPCAPQNAPEIRHPKSATRYNI